MPRIQVAATVFPLIVSSLFQVAYAQSDNLPDNVRPVPPPGIELSAGEREELEKMLAALSTSLEKLRKDKSEALRKEGMELLHVIGPNTQHQYHPESKAAVERSLDEIAKKGRERVPRAIHFTTYTLKYNQMRWVTIDASQPTQPGALCGPQ